jgi:hypothetical protein
MKWSEALAFYEKALAGYPEVHTDEKKNEGGEDGEDEEQFPEEAHIYVEAAQVAERIEGCTRAGELYRRAYDLYIEKGYQEDADRIQPKVGDLPPPPDEEGEKANDPAEDKTEAVEENL